MEELIMPRLVEAGVREPAREASVAAGAGAA